MFTILRKVNGTGVAIDALNNLHVFSKGVGVETFTPSNQYYQQLGDFTKSLTPRDQFVDVILSAFGLGDIKA